MFNVAKNETSKKNRLLPSAMLLLLFHLSCLLPCDLDAATTIRSAETEVQSTIELRATASAIAASKPDLDAKAETRRF